MWPGLNLLHPDMSESLLQYRVDRIAGAEQKALSYTPPFAGAMFPWESALVRRGVRRPAVGCHPRALQRLLLSPRVLA